MTPAKAQRGRPKGSGIDDKQRLVEIARCVRANPKLKPTTAIKAIGITDPSTVRRLRDKFNSMRSETRSPFSDRSDGDHPLRSAPLKRAEPARKVTAPLTEGGLETAAIASGYRTPPAALLGLGLTAATTMFEHQMYFAQRLFQLPQMQQFLRCQIEVTEYMLAVSGPSPGSRLSH